MEKLLYAKYAYVFLITMCDIYMLSCITCINIYNKSTTCHDLLKMKVITTLRITLPAERHGLQNQLIHPTRFYLIDIIV